MCAESPGGLPIERRAVHALLAIENAALGVAVSAEGAVVVLEALENKSCQNTVLGYKVKTRLRERGITLPSHHLLAEYCMPIWYHYSQRNW